MVAGNNELAVIVRKYESAVECGSHLVAIPDQAACDVALRKCLLLLRGLSIVMRSMKGLGVMGIISRRRNIILIVRNS